MRFRPRQKTGKTQPNWDVAIVAPIRLSKREVKIGGKCEAPLRLIGRKVKKMLRILERVHGARK
jgi:hypothetical protein